MLSAEVFENDLIRLAKDLLSARDGQSMLAICAGELSRIGSFDQVTFRIPKLKRLASTSTKPAKHEKVNLEISFAIDSTADDSHKRPVDNSITIPIEIDESLIGEAFLVPSDERVLTHHELKFYRRIIELFGSIYLNVCTTDSLRHLSIHDELTNCFNRRYMNECLDNAVDWAKRYERVFSLLMIDLDNFKEINDIHGHLIGDEILASIGTLINDEIRSSDLAFRFGGDEFAVILPETRNKGAELLGERLNDALGTRKREFLSNGTRLGLSYGVGTFFVDGHTSTELIAAADKACLTAKRSIN
jgi:diguanylate cyclase (GGDEF)-like protein